MTETERIARLREEISIHLQNELGTNAENAGDDQYYKAVAGIVQDYLAGKRGETKARVEKTGTKQVYYLCMEFLLGRSLKNNLYNLGLENIFSKALAEMDVKLENIYEQEPDAGLGNGGLGRLAACFLDALASGNYPAIGYSLRYEYGIFRQKLVDGWQTELPDFWLPGGQVWLKKLPEKAVEVHFDGHLEEEWHNQFHVIKHKDYTSVRAIPYDMFISGAGGKCVNKLRLWAATSPSFDMKLFNSGNYLRAMEQAAQAEVITKVLYPEDNHLEGKSLRLAQQYFLVSATIQDIIRRHLLKYSTLDNLPDLVAIHLNDTHPVLAVPEMMRVMLDECGYGWDQAWDIVIRTVAYTNHTVMAEALECWSEDLFKFRLPRIYQIVDEINRRFCSAMHSIGVDGYKIGRMAAINDGYVKMANLAVISAHSVNGVSALHSDILKESVFHDFYSEMPQKFKNVTNGITHRRWLCQCNPALCELLDEKIGHGYVANASELSKLMAFRDDETVLRRLWEIKRENKMRLVEYVKEAQGIDIDPNSIFDVHVKRLHEYKRQHLNALNILATYRYLRDNPNAPFTPRTYIFGAKAAPGYYFAKQIIRFIADLGVVINADERVNKKMKVVFLEDYRVTLAELLTPAADISEQISLAGTEASGTSNMKFMISGAVTIGTLDGANVEIHESVGDENILLFGMTTPQVNELKQRGYKPADIFNANPELKGALDELRKGFNGVPFKDIADSLMTSDPYMVLADYASYAAARKKSEQLYSDPIAWSRMCLVNIAQGGRFSADRAIADYTRNIWGAHPLPPLPHKAAAQPAAVQAPAGQTAKAAKSPAPPKAKK